MTKPKYRLDPPHGDRLYWVGEHTPGDSRVGHISANRNWFWRHQEVSDD